MISRLSWRKLKAEWSVKMKLPRLDKPMHSNQNKKSIQSQI